MMGLVLLISFSCQKEDTPQEDKDPVVTTYQVSGITKNTATYGGTVAYNDGAVIIRKGVCWNTTGNPTSLASDSNTTEVGGTGTFTSVMTGLMPGTTYYVRAYADSYITYYGPEVSFTTPKGKDVYTISREGSRAMTSSLGGRLYKNGTEIIMSGSTNFVKLTSVLVTETDDVYVAGYGYNTAGIEVATVSKNGIPTNLTDGTKHARPFSMVVVGNSPYSRPN